MERMKKRALLLGILLLSFVTVTGCGKKAEPIKPELVQIRNICDLATLECYYHNVAKSQKTAGSGITHWGEQDRKFWIEYTGIAWLGIDMSKVEMEVSGENIRLTMPKAKVLKIGIDDATLDEDSFIFSKDGFFNKNKITVEEQTDAIQKAQEKMKETVAANEELILTAQKRAETLIENYINHLGDAAGMTYQITWEYLEEE